MAIDPVCGKQIDEESVRRATGTTQYGANEVDPQQGTRRFHEGKWYYFDTLDCRVKFMANPAQYVQQ